MCRFRHISNTGAPELVTGPVGSLLTMFIESQQRSVRSLLRHRQVLPASLETHDLRLSVETKPFPDEGGECPPKTSSKNC